MNDEKRLYKPPFLNAVVSSGEEAAYSLSAASGHRSESAQDCPVVQQGKGCGKSA